MSFTATTDDAKRQARAWGSLGGLRFAANNDVNASAARARAAQVAGYQDGHGCKLCPTQIIPADLPEAERQRRSVALRKAHMKALAMRRHHGRQA